MEKFIEIESVLKRKRKPFTQSKEASMVLIQALGICRPQKILVEQKEKQKLKKCLTMRILSDILVYRKRGNEWKA